MTLLERERRGITVAGREFEIRIPASTPAAGEVPTFRVTRHAITRQLGYAWEMLLGNNGILTQLMVTNLGIRLPPISRDAVRSTGPAARPIANGFIWAVLILALLPPQLMVVLYSFSPRWGDTWPNRLGAPRSLQRRIGAPLGSLGAVSRPSSFGQTWR